MVILIADDDRLVRFTIKSILYDIRGDVGDIFLEAKNGAEVVALCSEHHPDIAFVDIRMPNLNGLEAIEQSRENAADTEYVIVSGYSDFEYAQRGMRLGVSEYLLKPVDEEELRKVMEKLSQKIKQHLADTNSRFRLEVMETFHYYAAAGLAENRKEEEIESSERYVVFMLRMRGGKNSRKYMEDAQKKLLQKISLSGEEIIGRGGCYAIAGNGYGTPCIIFKVTEEQTDYVLSRIRMISMSSIQENIRHYFMWFTEESLKNACIRCEELEKDLCLLMTESPGAVCRYEEMRAGEDERAFLFLTEKLMETWIQADGVACKEILNKMWRDYKDKDLLLNLKNLSSFCGLITGGEVPADSLKVFCRSFVENSDEMYSFLSPEEGDVTEKIKEYVQKYYMNDISIGRIAENFGLTANYLSTIFHQRTGRKLIDYLTEVRMEAAKKLLCENLTASVQDIALMVGYNSSRHFSTLFQKQTGITPSAYRKIRNGEEIVENRT